MNEENREGTIESDEAEQPRRKIVTEVGPGQEATPVRVTARSGWPGGTIHPTERAYRFEVVEHTNGLDVRTWRYAIRADAQEMSDVAEWLALELERAQERIEELRVHGRARVRAEFYLGELLDIIDSTESLAEAALAAAHGYRCERAVAERHEKIVLEAYALLGKERPT